MHRVLRAAISALAAALAACSGGGGTPSLPSGSAVGAQGVSISILIPSTSAQGGSVRRAFVSSSTKSGSIVIAPSPTCGSSCSPGVTIAANLTSSGPNCTLGGNGLQCTIPLSLNPGTYTGNITTYDGPLVSNAPTGSVLGIATSFPITVVRSQNNTIALTLNGVPKSVTLTPVNTALGTAVAANGYAGVLNNSPDVQYSMVAKDADGNVIVGAGAPAFTVSCASCSASSLNPTVSGSTLHVAVGDILYTGANNHSFPVTLSSTSSQCSVSGAVCSASVTFHLAQYFAVARSSTVTVWTVGLSTPPVTITNVTGVSDAQFDTNGNLWVADNLANAIYEFAPPFTASSMPILTVTTGISNPKRIALEFATGKLYVANATNVTEYDPPYTGAPTATITNGISSPVDLGIAYNLSKRLYVVNSTGSITGYDAPLNGAAPAISITNGISSPSTFELYNDGSMWVANAGATPTIAHYPAAPATTADVTITSSSSYPLSTPDGLVDDCNGDLVVADSGSRSVNRYTATGSGIGTVGLNWGWPYAPTVDRSCSLWVNDKQNNFLSSFDYPYTAGTQPSYTLSGNVGGGYRIAQYP